MQNNFKNKEEFFHFLQSEINLEAKIEDEEKMEEEVYVEKMIDYLHESNFLENGRICRHQGRGIKVDAFDINATENAIDIIVAHYKSGENEIPRVGKPEIKKAFKRAKTFLKKSRIGSSFYKTFEDSAEVRDLSNLIHSNFQSLKSARIILITNGITGPFEGVTEMLDDFSISYQLWDFERLWRQVSSGMKKEFITLDFISEGYQPIKCVDAYDGKKLYTTYLTLIPGILLRDLYDKYGTRLLERNVRAFLQARSNVNRGIRDTIIEQPNMFLAYNNGITVTANKVEIDIDEDGHKSILSISDFQVVNGGQTVASLWHTSVRNKASLKNVYLQMKLTVINNSKMIDDIAPLISKYSNAQNAVNTADFSANDPFHRNLESVALSVYAPDPTGGTRQSIWFYERARGNYAETRARERTPARIKAWDRIHPRKQKFDKLVVAKLENTWRKIPHIVSLGGQKNFSHFTVYVQEKIASENDIKVDVNYFHNLIAKFIVWKNTEKIINAQKLPGYRANIVTYSLSWLLSNKPKIINLKEIWEKQGINDTLASALDVVTQHIRNIITDTEGNVTEWCKKEEVWTKIRKKKIDLDAPVEIRSKSVESKSTPKEINWDDFTNKELWESLINWIDSEGKLDGKDLEFGKGIVKAIEKNGAPSLPQIKVANKILNNARAKGFSE
jgi:hypothetical protein